MLGYLPQQLSEKEILQIVKETATQIGADNMKDMGKLMSAVRPKVVDRADENLVSQIVKEYLNSKYKKRTQCKLSSFFFIFVIFFKLKS